MDGTPVGPMDGTPVGPMDGTPVGRVHGIPVGPADRDPLEETVRAASLLAAQDNARELFDEVLRRGMVRPGALESQVSDQVRDLGAELFGTDRHWHKRVVRSGPNTLRPYRDNPPDRTIGDDDIVFLDFGPIFAEWEADFGRTFVLGRDPVKLRLAADLPRLFEAGRTWFEAHPDITGSQLYNYVCELARESGWQFGGAHSGHLVGEFPHETVDGDRIESYIAPGSDNVMRRDLPSGRRAHWILEIHLVDAERQIGGFYEQLLTL
ncbi:MAG TPA: M24 family metallopeptidase [Pseudonocardia sp.]|jgi:Xaa-Pro aminopeptidase|nr:M24 family metallopeptidase [Pseudonocardia sp.]